MSGEGPVAEPPVASFPLHIERGKVREFAVAAAGGEPEPGAAVPPFFLATGLNFSGHSEQVVAALGLDMTRVLHGEEEVTFPHGPPRVGDVLDAVTRVERRWRRPARRGGMLRLVRLVTDYRDAGGALVATQRSTLLETPPAAKEDDARGR